MGYVYILQQENEDLFKIGRTKNDINERIKQLSTGNAKNLKLFDFIQSDKENIVEHYLHKKLYKFQVKTSSYAKEFYALPTTKLKYYLKEARSFIADYIQIQNEIESYQQVDIHNELKTHTPQIKQMYEELKSIKGKIELLEYQKKYIENQIKSFIGEYEGIEDVATWYYQDKQKINIKRLKEEEPETYERFLEKEKSRIFRLL